MTDFDPYSQKIADVCALIRQHGKCEEWELFKNSERGLEVLCAIVDAVRAEAKAAVPGGMTHVGMLALGCVEGDELSAWDIEPDNKVIDALQLDLVRTSADVHMILYAAPHQQEPK